MIHAKQWIGRVINIQRDIFPQIDCLPERDKPHTTHHHHVLTVPGFDGEIALVVRVRTRSGLFVIQNNGRMHNGPPTGRISNRPRKRVEYLAVRGDDEERQEEG